MISFLTRDYDELEEQLKSNNDCKLRFDSRNLVVITNTDQVSPTCIYVAQISIFTCRPSSMIHPQRTTEGGCYLYTLQQRHSLRLQ